MALRIDRPQEGSLLRILVERRNEVSRGKKKSIIEVFGSSHFQDLPNHMVKYFSELERKTRGEAYDVVEESVQFSRYLEGEGGTTRFEVHHPPTLKLKMGKLEVGLDFPIERVVFSRLLRFLGETGEARGDVKGLELVYRKDRGYVLEVMTKGREPEEIPGAIKVSTGGNRYTFYLNTHDLQEAVEKLKMFLKKREQ